MKFNWLYEILDEKNGKDEAFEKIASEILKRFGEDREKAEEQKGKEKEETPEDKWLKEEEEKSKDKEEKSKDKEEKSKDKEEKSKDKELKEEEEKTFGENGVNDQKRLLDEEKAEAQKERETKTFEANGSKKAKEEKVGKEAKEKTDEETREETNEKEKEEAKEEEVKAKDKELKEERNYDFEEEKGREEIVKNLEGVTAKAMAGAVEDTNINDGDMANELLSLRKKYEEDTAMLKKQVYETKLSGLVDAEILKNGGRNLKAINSLIEKSDLGIDENGKLFGLCLEKIMEEAPYLFDMENRKVQGTGVFLGVKKGSESVLSQFEKGVFGR